MINPPKSVFAHANHGRVNIDLYVGDKPFIAKLDALFAAPSNVLEAPPDISGMAGQDAQGSEPSNHIPEGPPAPLNLMSWDGKAVAAQRQRSVDCRFATNRIASPGRVARLVHLERRAAELEVLAALSNRVQRLESLSEGQSRMLTSNFAMSKMRLRFLA